MSQRTAMITQLAKLRKVQRDAIASENDALPPADVLIVHGQSKRRRDGKLSNAVLGNTCRAGAIGEHTASYRAAYSLPRRRRWRADNPMCRRFCRQCDPLLLTISGDSSRRLHNGNGYWDCKPRFKTVRNQDIIKGSYYLLSP